MRVRQASVISQADGSLSASRKELFPDVENLFQGAFRDVEAAGLVFPVFDGVFHWLHDRLFVGVAEGDDGLDYKIIVDVKDFADFVSVNGAEPAGTNSFLEGGQDEVFDGGAGIELIVLPGDVFVDEDDGVSGGLLAGRRIPSRRDVSSPSQCREDSLAKIGVDDEDVSEGLKIGGGGGNAGCVNKFSEGLERHGVLPESSN